MSDFLRHLPYSHSYTDGVTFNSPVFTVGLWVSLGGHPPHSHLKGQREQHMQEGSQIVGISHPNLQQKQSRHQGTSPTNEDLHPWDPKSRETLAECPRKHSQERQAGQSGGGRLGTWFQGKLTVKPWPRPWPTASASDSGRNGQKLPCS